MTGEEKFHDRVASAFGVRGFLGSAVGAGIGTGLDVPHEWDTHIGGYRLRYISGFGINLTHQAFAFGLDYALHEDPRYFPSERRGLRPRLLNVLKQSVISRRDDGSEGVAYSRLISDFASAQVGGAWQPPSDQGFGNGAGARHPQARSGQRYQSYSGIRSLCAACFHPGPALSA